MLWVNMKSTDTSFKCKINEKQCKCSASAFMSNKLFFKFGITTTFSDYICKSDYY